MAAIKKLKGSGILEVIIAMTIMLIVFGIAMMIFTNVTTMSLSAKKLRAAALVNKTLLLTEQEKEPSGRSFTADDFRLEVKITPFPDNDQVSTVSVTAYDEQQQVVASVQKTIIVQP